MVFGEGCIEQDIAEGVLLQLLPWRWKKACFKVAMLLEQWRDEGLLRSLLLT